MSEASGTHETAQPLWSPTPKRAAESRMGRFMAAHGFKEYPALHTWSLEDPAAFWKAVWSDLAIVGDPGEVIVGTVGSGTDQAPTDIRDTRFFPDGRVSYAENALHGRGVDGATEAVVALDEEGNRRALSWDDLRAEVAAAAAALRSDGVRVGDRVAIWLPAGAHALVLLLAVNAIGAVSSSVSPDFGAAGALDRFGQIGPKVLVGCRGYRYGGKAFDITDRVTDVAAELPGVERTVWLEDWDTWLSPHRGSPLTFERLPFDHPLYVLYSSGTTGKPKCITHGAGRVLLKHMTEHALHSDVRPGDRATWFTTTGWMMWNWIVSALTVGATVVLYDGNPAYPTIGRLFSLVDDERLRLLGVSAKFIDSVAKARYEPKHHHDLSSLATLGSTGSPLSPEGFAFVYDSIKTDVHLASIAGGTDLCGCFVAGDPTSPVWSGEIQRPALGMDVHAWSDSGTDVAVGVAGELVCTAAFPSIPIGFWGDDTSTDPRGARFSAAYFDRYKGIWHHGDFMTVTERGGYVIHGRSDSTLNPGGVRIGTAEIYRVVEQIPAVMESLVFGQDWDGDSRVILLVRLADGATLSDDMRADIRARIRTACTPRHVPAKIVAVADLPRTRSNKLVELAVADAVNKRPVRNTEGLANPEALWAIAELEELQT
jgi:acetoacetyl-CoA synthetase